MSCLLFVELLSSGKCQALHEFPVALRMRKGLVRLCVCRAVDQDEKTVVSQAVSQVENVWLRVSLRKLCQQGKEPQGWVLSSRVRCEYLNHYRDNLFHSKL